MKTTKQLGIWMDHSNAVLMELTDGPIVQSNVLSKFTHQEKEFSLNKSERLMHNKEQHEQNDFYKDLSELIRNYDEVIIFGPTNAKDELYNLLKTNHLFNDIKIEVKHADKMTDIQKHTFVKEYFKYSIKKALVD